MKFQLFAPAHAATEVRVAVGVRGRGKRNAGEDQRGHSDHLLHDRGDEDHGPDSRLDHAALRHNAYC
ncbi:hypothetical protein [Streptomyces sp. H27-H5]|uniref:hypothetical protein n=1 Tax=Streptomyces sp. H27-H5 TaxID=2996460 RepID=UPI002D1E4579|nr:hypothetical protein [Streptomyces sp. H27-H5]